MCGISAWRSSRAARRCSRRVKARADDVVNEELGTLWL